MKRNQQGFSLVELAIGLAVITILILAVSFSAGIRDNARLQSAAKSIESLRLSAENYLSNGNLDYSGLTVAALKTANLLPSSFDGTKDNPWGGSFAIGPNGTDKTHFDIALGGISQTIGTKLTNSFQNTAASAYDTSRSTWTITF